MSQQGALLYWRVVSNTLDYCNGRMYNTQYRCAVRFLAGTFTMPFKISFVRESV